MELSNIPFMDFWVMHEWTSQYGFGFYVAYLNMSEFVSGTLFKLKIFNQKFGKCVINVCMYASLYWNAWITNDYACTFKIWILVPLEQAEGFGYLHNTREFWLWTKHCLAEKFNTLNLTNSTLLHLDVMYWAFACSAFDGLGLLLFQIIPIFPIVIPTTFFSPECSLIGALCSLYKMDVKREDLRGN